MVGNWQRYISVLWSKLIRPSTCMQAALCVSLTTVTTLSAKEAESLIRLTDGSLGYGRLLAAQHSDQLSFHVDGFARPFSFDLKQIHSVRRLNILPSNSAPEPFKDLWMVKLDHQQQVCGQIIELSSKQLVIESPSIGRQAIGREHLRSISKPDNGGQLIRSHSEGSDWRELNARLDWVVEPFKLETGQAGSRMQSNFQMPERVEIRFSLRWQQLPNFAIGFECADENRNAQANIVFGRGNANQNPPPVVGRMKCLGSLEVWDNLLVLVGDSELKSDFVVLQELLPESFCDLIVYLDRPGRTLSIQTTDGQLHSVPIGSQVPGKSVAFNIQNFGKGIAIEDLELWSWDGGLPNQDFSAQPIVVKQDLSTIDGDLRGWDVESRSWQIQTDESMFALPVDQLRTAIWTNVHSDANQASKPNPDSTLITLQDGTRLLGKMLPAESETSMQFQATMIDGVFDVPMVMIRELKTFVPLSNSSSRSLTVSVGRSQLAGKLLDKTPDGALSSLVWQPSASMNAAELDHQFSGVIQQKNFRPSTAAQKNAKPPAPERIEVRQQPGIFEQLLGLGGGNPRPARKPADRAERKPAERAERTASEMPLSPKHTAQIQFRTGDILDANIVKIDEAGIQFESDQTKTSLVPHAVVDRILLSRSNAHAIPDDQRQRLLTVPRSRQHDPPTHLIISESGDYLRGHLVQHHNNKTLLEVRGEVLELPSDELTEIIWLYERNWSLRTDNSNGSDVAESASVGQPESNRDLVHLILQSDQGTTFQPRAVDDGIIHGQSELLGDISLPLSQLKSLYFGPKAIVKARQRHGSAYGLTLAKAPRDQSHQSGDAPPSASHPLIGKQAPDFTLKTLSEDSFQLGAFRNRIVVLDFWASWCGPCMQSLPQLHELVQQINSDALQMVAINIEEAKPKIEIARTRLPENCLIALDIDGQVSVAYQAQSIPQTVIIDQAGVVAKVIVGGGPAAMQQIQETLDRLLKSERQPSVSQAE